MQAWHGILVEKIHEIQENNRGNTGDLFSKIKATLWGIWMVNIRKKFFKMQLDVDVSPPANIMNFCQTLTHMTFDPDLSDLWPWPMWLPNITCNMSILYDCKVRPENPFFYLVTLTFDLWPWSVRSTLGSSTSMPWPNFTTLGTVLLKIWINF